MIRGLMIFTADAKPIYSMMFDETPSDGENKLAINALVSAVISFVPMLSGGSLDEISLGDARIILYTKDEFIFSLAVDSEDKNDHQKHLQSIAEEFQDRYESMIDISIDAIAYDKDEFTKILRKKKLL